MTENQHTSDAWLLEFIRAFEAELGRLPTVWDMVMFHEAQASVRMSREADNVGD